MADDPQATIYSIDTSALIHGWVRAYPPNTFPTVWQRLDELITSGLLKASIEVLNELEKKDDDLSVWCKERPAMFIDVDDATQASMQHIMGTYPKLVDTSKGRSGADPFVIALGPSSRPTAHCCDRRTWRQRQQAQDPVRLPTGRIALHQLAAAHRRTAMAIWVTPIQQLR